MTAKHTAIFTPQYAEDSGPGSKFSSTVPYRAFLENWIREHQIRSILDLGCGDMEVMRRVNRSSFTDDYVVHYRGVDCIEARIDANQRRFPQWCFTHADLRMYPIQGAGWDKPHSLVLVKDVIQHWTTSEILDWLKTFKPYQALITNCNYGPTVNTEIETGGWRAIDLTKPPFSVGEVIFQWTHNGATKDVVLIQST